MAADLRLENPRHPDFKERMVLLYLYGVVSVVLGVTAFLFGDGLYVGFAIIASAFLSFWAGSGLKASIIGGGVSGNAAQVWFGLVAAVVFCGLAASLAWHSGFIVKIFDISIKGPYWCLIGFVLAWMATTRQHVNSTSMPSQETKVD